MSIPRTGFRLRELRLRRPTHLLSTNWQRLSLSPETLPDKSNCSTYGGVRPTVVEIVQTCRGPAKSSAADNLPPSPPAAKSLSCFQRAIESYPSKDLTSSGQSAISMEYHADQGFGRTECQGFAKLIDQQLYLFHAQTTRRGRLRLARVGRPRHYADQHPSLTGQSPKEATWLGQAAPYQSYRSTACRPGISVQVLV